MMDCEWPLGMIHFSLILHVGIKYAEEPFIMGMFFYLRINGYIFRPPTHTSGHFYTEVAPTSKGLTLVEVLFGGMIAVNL